MTSSVGFAPSGVHANAAAYNVDAVAKRPPETRDDVVAPVNTTNEQAAKSDLSLLKTSGGSTGRNLDITV